jgi:ABC-type transporter Mla maintaining outer membrane lipid asymmetry ATPase subunit MlaF
MDDAKEDRAPVSTPYVVETGGLTKRFGKRVAVDNVDLRVPCGSALWLPRAERRR